MSSSSSSSNYEMSTSRNREAAKAKKPVEVGEVRLSEVAVGGQKPISKGADGPSLVSSPFFCGAEASFSAEIWRIMVFWSCARSHLSQSEC